jgi:hypothetical protein
MRRAWYAPPWAPLVATCRQPLGNGRRNFEKNIAAASDLGNLVRDEIMNAAAAEIPRDLTEHRCDRVFDVASVIFPQVLDLQRGWIREDVGFTTGNTLNDVGGDMFRARLVERDVLRYVGVDRTPDRRHNKWLYFRTAKDRDRF